MKASHIAAYILAFGLTAASADETRNLIGDGGFDDPDDPMRRWVAHYQMDVNNANDINPISIVPHESGRRNVMRIKADANVESPVVPFDVERRYRANLFVKGGPYRIFFAGYQWKPGIRPNDDPQPEELRMLYRSKRETGNAASWQRISLEIPGVKASDLSVRHLRSVRFIRLYIVFANTGFIDDVSIVHVQ